MKLFQKKIFILFTVLMAVLCVISIVIAVNISLSLTNRQKVAVKNIQASKKPDAVKVDKQVSAVDVMNIDKAKPQLFFLNGELITSKNALLLENQNILVPLDWIFEKTGISFEYYHSDEILEAKINGVRVIAKIGKHTFTINGIQESLQTAPVISRGHIYVPSELLEKIEGVSISWFQNQNAVYTNFYPDYKNLKELCGIKLLRSVGKTVNISDIGMNKVFWKSGNTIPSTPEFVFSTDKESWLLKLSDKTLLFNRTNGFIPVSVPVGQAVSFSRDDKYLYWVDKNKKMSYVYDIGEKNITSLGEYYRKIGSAARKGEVKGEGGYLYYYKKGKRSKLVALSESNDQAEPDYTVIERRKKVVFEGKGEISPDKKRVLYYKKEKGYYIANIDGTGIKFIGNALEASWLTSSKIFMKTNTQKMITGVDGKTKAVVNSEWKKVGQTAKGELFFTDSSSLFCEIGGKEVKTGKLPPRCEYVYAVHAKGPYITVSPQGDNVSFVSEGSTVSVGSYHSLLKKLIKDARETNIAKDTNNVNSGNNTNSINNTDLGRSIISAPDGKKFAIVQQDNEFINIVLVSNKVIKTISMGIPSTEINASGFQLQWVSDNVMIVTTPSRGFIVNLNNSTQVYEWEEKDKSVIRYIVPAL